MLNLFQLTNRNLSHVPENDSFLTGQTIAYNLLQSVQA